MEREDEMKFAHINTIRPTPERQTVTTVAEIATVELPVTVGAGNGDNPHYVTFVTRGTGIHIRVFLASRQDANELHRAVATALTRATVYVQLHRALAGVQAGITGFALWATAAPSKQRAYASVAVFRLDPPNVGTVLLCPWLRHHGCSR